MNKSWMQRDIPALMRELCLAAGYYPTRDSISIRYTLMLRIGALSEKAWHDSLSIKAQKWYNTAVEAHEHHKPLPGFGDQVKFTPKPPPEEPRAMTMARMLIRNSDANWMQYQDACLMEGVSWTRENWPRVQKSLFRTFLSVLENEDCLNDKGREVLNGKLLGGNRYGENERTAEVPDQD